MFIIFILLYCNNMLYGNVIIEYSLIYINDLLSNCLQHRIKDNYILNKKSVTSKYVIFIFSYWF